MEGKTDYNLQSFLSAFPEGLEVKKHRAVNLARSYSNKPQKEKGYLHIDYPSVGRSVNSIDNIVGETRKHPEIVPEVVEKLIKTGIDFESIEEPSNKYAYEWVDKKLSSDAVKETIIKIGPIVLPHLERSKEEYAKTLAEAVRQKFNLQSPSSKSEI
jgi:hypothetical protein